MGRRGAVCEEQVREEEVCEDISSTGNCDDDIQHVLIPRQRLSFCDRQKSEADGAGIYFDLMQTCSVLYLYIVAVARVC